MILIMGVAGAGKSYFINQLAGKQVVEEGTDLETCTQSCSLVPVDIGPSQILVVDVPDFDDTIRADSEILQEIARLLAAQYQLGVNLKGIIYIHRITDKRYSASALKNLEMVKKICGDAALKNVLLVTSRWAEIPEDVGLNHERELKENFWAYMIARGSNMCRFRSDRNSALSVVSQLLVKDTIVLGLQRQLVDQEKPLNETEAGSYLNDDLERLKMAYQLELASLDKKLEIFESDRAPTRQIQHDWHKEQDRLKQAQDQQQSLQRHVGSEVRGEIDSAKRRKSALGQALAFVPAAINMLGLFVGIPSIATDNL
ncbi:hypothetical protein EJ08DRAFT_578327 [Tothia fuscella]|uniref:AIG1-type G domain-containing protein n=1 Tax=Tothia fuscella TaxID=1048955 RepID=A0A9P4U4G9_9PEZI|nr:hypothetical protein EJ08DRAFT_578327 [Tothia fuscella]